MNDADQNSARTSDEGSSELELSGSVPTQEETEACIAAIDLGSNSFHMAIARVLHDEVRPLGKLTEKVQLAAGLNEYGLIEEPYRSVALQCLQRFAQRIAGIPAGSVRVVGTNALRKASDDVFLDEVKQALGVSVEVIAGREEARLIYLGVAHTLADDEGHRLVVDIGGGSTELIIGERFETKAMESLHMGCVSFTKRYFPDGAISKHGFFAAVTAAKQELLMLESTYKAMGWQSAVGASGSVKSILQVLQAKDAHAEVISAKALGELVEQTLQFESIDALDLPGLKNERKPIFPAGLAILLAIFEQLQIDEMSFSHGALREGVLYDLLGRLSHEDVRDRTLQSLTARYHIDVKQAERVQQTALHAFDQVAASWNMADSYYRELLRRAAWLHELGLDIAHSRFQRHGAYVIRVSDLPGFSRQEQACLACLVESHRRRFRMDVMADFPESVKMPLMRLSVILRLATLLHHHRRDQYLPNFLISVADEYVQLSFPDGWLDAHPLTLADLDTEAAYLHAVGIELSYH